MSRRYKPNKMQQKYFNQKYIKCRRCQKYKKKTTHCNTEPRKFDRKIYITSCEAARLTTL